MPVVLTGVLLAVVLVVAAVVNRTDAPSESSVDVGFLRDMADHHDQAVRMSLLVIPLEGASPAVRDVAASIIASQRHDVGRIDAWLDDWGHGRGTPTRKAMTWMGHRGLAPSAMPGMATAADLDALAAATGVDAERRFLDLMLAHHRAGVTMAERAAVGASSPKVVRLAELIAAGQEKEIRELQSLQRQLETFGTLDVPRG